MKGLSLAARYRPQRFSDVCGQELITCALSRASAQDQPQAAYLLSGTRGVGKTSIARIFAKALNCAKGPAAEPCNECAQCQKITRGNHVDVAEIDGASNNSVEDARALRENIGYAPMEGRYKIFIIDEAHMLSRSAFNALLKTLEEPPPRVLFIFATTEAHKFPVTIVSRCQHFVFRQLGEDALCAHLEKVLTAEAIRSEPGALRLIARRAQGSVRDAMSLLDQALALGDAELNEKRTRQLLGLAGQELFQSLFQAMAARNLSQIAEICAQIASQALDIAFFNRELALHLRNFFLLRQGGEGMLPSLGLAPDEANFYASCAALFPPAQLHAAWQMCLESQKGIAQNPEPVAALELLLLNIALLPQLLPIAQLENAPGQINPHPQAQVLTSPKPPLAGASEERSAVAENLSARDTSPKQEACAQKSSPPKDEGPISAPAKSLDWEAFRKYCRAERAAKNLAPQERLLHDLVSRWDGELLTLTPKSERQHSDLLAAQPVLEQALSNYCQGHAPKIAIRPPKVARPQSDLMAEAKERPEVRLCMDILDATLLNCSETR